MNYYRKYFEVTGYCADADTWCVPCAQAIYGRLGGELELTAKDHEGNEVHPIFLGTEWDDTPCCSSCRTPIDVTLAPSR